MITLSGAPTGGRPIEAHTVIVTGRKTNVRTAHAPTTLLGCGGVPRGGPLPAAPTPLSARTGRGQGGGWPHRVGGRRFRGASPFQPAPKIPETGRRRPPRKRLLCENNTPSVHPLGGYGPLDRSRPMAARGGGVSTHVIALVRGGRALGGRAALAGCLRRPSTLLKGEPRVV